MRGSPDGALASRMQSRGICRLSKEEARDWPRHADRAGGWAWGRAASEPCHSPVLHRSRIFHAAGPFHSVPAAAAWMVCPDATEAPIAPALPADLGHILPIHHHDDLVAADTRRTPGPCIIARIVMRIHGAPEMAVVMGHMLCNRRGVGCGVATKKAEQTAYLPVLTWVGGRQRRTATC